MNLIRSSGSIFPVPFQLVHLGIVFALQFIFFPCIFVSHRFQAAHSPVAVIHSLQHGLILHSPVHSGLCTFHALQPLHCFCKGQGHIRSRGVRGEDARILLRQLLPQLIQALVCFAAGHVLHCSAIFLQTAVLALHFSQLGFIQPEALALQGVQHILGILVSLKFLIVLEPLHNGSSLFLHTLPCQLRIGCDVFIQAVQLLRQLLGIAAGMEHLFQIFRSRLHTGRLHDFSAGHLALELHQLLQPIHILLQLLILLPQGFRFRLLPPGIADVWIASVKGTHIVRGRLDLLIIKYDIETILLQGICGIVFDNHAIMAALFGCL